MFDIHNNRKKCRPDALSVARYIINYSNKKKHLISNLKLQKLLYCVQAHYLISKSGEPCFDDEIEAWDFGPIIPDVYREFKRYGSTSIPTITSYVVYDTNNIWQSRTELFDERILSKKDRKRINKVIDYFENHSATDLTLLTQRQKPWKDAVHSYRRIITKDAIQQYFAN